MYLPPLCARQPISPIAFDHTCQAALKIDLGSAFKVEPQQKSPRLRTHKQDSRPAASNLIKAPKLRERGDDGGVLAERRAVGATGYVVAEQAARRAACGRPAGISGIIHVLKSGGRWVDAPSSYGPRKMLYNRFVRWATKGVWLELFEVLAAASGPPTKVLLDSSAVKAHRCASGGKGGSQAIGRSRGGRTTKIHALSDGWGRPFAFLLTGGQAADCQAAELRISRRRSPGAGKIASHPTSTADVTPSSACSAGSRISAASPRGTIASPKTISAPSASPLLSVTGYESGA